jgi:hypothetical protein
MRSGGSSPLAPEEANHWPHRGDQFPPGMISGVSSQPLTCMAKEVASKALSGRAALQAPFDEFALLISLG